MSGQPPSPTPSATYTGPGGPGSSPPPGVMHGRVCVVTGGTRGIGRATARRLASLGAELVLIGRDQKLLDETVATIAGETGNDRISAIRIDLASMNSIRKGAAEILQRWPAIQVLVNNAGVNAKRRTATAEGRELTLAVNHLAPFLLTSILAPALIRAAPSRVVNVTSVFAHLATLDLDDVEAGRQRYDSTRAYNRSKLANVMFTLELADRLRGTGVTANAVSPGLVATDLLREHWYMTSPKLRFWHGMLMTPEQAAERVVRVATSPALERVTGAILAGSDKPARVPRGARDPGRRTRLWELTAIMTTAPTIPVRIPTR